jgi:hypothetical protein
LGASTSTANVHHHPMDTDGQANVGGANTRKADSRIGGMNGLARTMPGEASSSSAFSQWDRGRESISRSTGGGSSGGGGGGHQGGGGGVDDGGIAPDLVSVPFPFSVAQSSLSLLDAMPDSGGAGSSQQLWGLDPHAAGTVSVADWLGLQLLPTEQEQQQQRAHQTQGTQQPPVPVPAPPPPPTTTAAAAQQHHLQTGLRQHPATRHTQQSNWGNMQ